MKQNNLDTIKKIYLFFSMFTQENRTLQFQVPATPEIKTTGNFSQKDAEQEFIKLRNIDVAKALTFAKNALDSFPTSTVFLFELGFDSFRKGLLKDAEKKFQTLTEVAPENLQAKKLLIEIYLRTFQINKVQSLIDAVLRQDPQDLKIWILKSKKEMIEGDVVAARASADKARSIDMNNNSELVLTLAQIEIAELKFDVARSRIKYYQENVDPDSLEAQLLEAQLALVGSDYPLTQSICSKILKKNPEDTGALITLGQASVASMDFSEANRCVQEASRLQPDNPGVKLLMSQIELFENIKTPSKIRVKSDLQMLVQQYPKNIAALNALGYLCYIQEDFAEAQKYFETVLNIYPEDSTAQGALADILLRQGKTQDAKKFAELSCRTNWKNLQGLFIQAKVALIQTPPDYISALVPMKAIERYYPRLDIMSDKVQYLSNNEQEPFLPAFQQAKTQLLSWMQIKTLITPSFHLSVVV